MQKEQKLFWSVSKPLRWLGLTVDEWIVLLVGLIPGLFLINDRRGLLGISAIAAGFVGMYLLKKFKKLSEFFLIKSWLVSRKYLPIPSRNFPNMQGNRVYK